DHRVEPRVLSPDEVAERGVGRLAAGRPVERGDAVHPGRDQRLGDQLRGHAEPLGQFRDLRRAAAFAGELIRRGAHRLRQFLHGARYVYIPGGVAEVLLDLAEDDRGRVAQETGAALRVEVVYSLDQRQVRHLHEVLGQLAVTSVAQRDVPRVPHVILDQFRAQPFPFRVLWRQLLETPEQDHRFGALLRVGRGHAGLVALAARLGIGRAHGATLVPAGNGRMGPQAGTYHGAASIFAGQRYVT